MKYIVIIGIGAVVIGLLLSAATYVTLGNEIAWYFAKFVAAPAGLITSGLIFVIYDHIWPKNSKKNDKNTNIKNI